MNQNNDNIIKKPLKIAIGSDHKGYQLKQFLITELTPLGVSFIDLGTNSSQSVDYPDFGLKVCQLVKASQVDCGILICYTGIGMSIVANKVKGIRAGLVGSIEDAILTKQHNDANVICLSSKNTSFDLAKEIIINFLNTDFEGGRHQERLNKVKDIEEDLYC